jgi:hypothetical protein
MPSLLVWLGWVNLFIGLASAQNCGNYGTVNGTSCACPVGFGGSDCLAPACGGTLFQGSSRKTVSSSNGGNITAAGCACETGWTGEGCNVCRVASACSSGLVSVNSADPTSVANQETGQNNSMTCNSGAIVYAAGQMSCNVNVCLRTAFLLPKRSSSRGTSRTQHYKAHSLVHLF